MKATPGSEGRKEPWENAPKVSIENGARRWDEEVGTEEEREILRDSEKEATDRAEAGKERYEGAEG